MERAHKGETGKSGRWLLMVPALLAVALFTALGVWQLERRVWKLDLIARVDARVHAPPVAAPGPTAWPHVTRAGDEYRHVRLQGRFDNDRETFVKAVTELGPGFWVLVPLETERGFTVLVNRGFVPSDKRAPDARGAAQPRGEVAVTGLLRMTEPGGGFLRSNDPADDRWYSRDVAAIAARRGLGTIAPYFVDADASRSQDWPRGGLTVIRFRNTHLVYALTWFAMAILAAAMTVRAIRSSAP